MLPVSWRPARVRGLIRVGPNEDGGYVLPSTILNSTEVLFGLGLSTNWSFEEQFRKQSNCKVICYDHTVNNLFVLRKIAVDLTGFVAGKQRFTWAKLRYMFKYMEYKKFFNGLDVIHRQVKVGYDRENSVSIGTILKTIGTQKVV